MPGEFWTEQELTILMDNYEEMTCRDIAKILGRTTRSVQHKFGQLGLKRRLPQVGDIKQDWEIMEIYTRNIGKHNVSRCKLRHIKDGRTKDRKLTDFQQGTAGVSKHVRPDLRERSLTHGLSWHPLYNAYNSMINRCENPNVINYNNYGGRGIKICEEWRNDFKKYYDWCMENGWAEGLSVERIDNNGNYCPDNCKLATRIEQCANKRTTRRITAWGETKSASLWAMDLRCKATYHSIIYRVKHGWSAEDAISKPTWRNEEKDNFIAHKDLYYFLKRKHPNVLEEFLSLADSPRQSV